MRLGTARPAPPRTGSPVWITAAALAGVLVIGALIGFFIGGGTAGDDGDDGDAATEAFSGASALEDAHNSCTNLDPGGTVSLADEGRSIIIDTVSEYGDPGGMDCVLSELARRSPSRRRSAAPPP